MDGFPSSTRAAVPAGPDVTSAVAPPSRPADPRPTPVAPRARQQRTGRGWLVAATLALALLAAAAAVVSWDAQYVMVASARHAYVIAALEAGIPDAGAAVFAALGIAVALHGRRAMRPRALNLACVGLSLTMNAMAAGPGWREAAIWVMPAAVYALASDTLIGVVRAHAIARMRPAGDVLAGDDATPLVVAGHVLLWLLRLVVAPASTLAGIRRWLISETSAAPRYRAARSADMVPAASQPARQQRSANGKLGKQDLLIALAAQRHDLHALPLDQVAAIAGGIAGDVDLHPGTARRVLRAHVRALQADAAGGAAEPEP